MKSLLQNDDNYGSKIKNEDFDNIKLSENIFEETLITISTP